MIQAAKRRSIRGARISDAFGVRTGVSVWPFLVSASLGVLRKVDYRRASQNELRLSGRCRPAVLMTQGAADDVNMTVAFRSENAFQTNGFHPNRKLFELFKT